MKWSSGSIKRVSLLICAFLVLVIAVTLVPACGGGGTTTSSTPSTSGTPTTTSVKPPAGAIVLTCVSGWSEPWTGNIKLHEFIDRINKAANGKIFIKFLGGAEVAPISESGGLVRDGVFDMCLNAPAYYAGLCPAAVITHFTPADPVLNRKLGINDLLNTQLRQKMNCYSPGQIWRGEAFGVLSKAPVTSANWKGILSHTLPIFTPGLTYLGASTVSLTTAEFYVGLERGVVDMIPQPVGAVPWDLRLYEVADYIVEPLMPIVSSGPLLFNGKKWDSLPEDMRKLITDTIIAMEPEVYTYYTEASVKYQKKMEEQGMKVSLLTGAEADRYIYAFSTFTWKDTIRVNGDVAKAFYEAAKPYFDWAVKNPPY